MHQLQRYLHWLDLAMVVHTTETIRIMVFYVELPLKGVKKLQLVPNMATGVNGSDLDL